MKEGWTYKKLGEIALDMYRGSGIKRDQVTKDGVLCVRYGEIYTTYNYAFKECVSHTEECFLASPKYFSHGDLLFAITGESVEDIGKTIAYLGHDKCLLGGDIVCMKHEQNPKYLAYALSSRDAIRQKGLGKTKLKVVHTNIPALSEIKIPIAPLPEQQRIVERLDAAFAHIDELKANAEKQLTEARALFQKCLTKAMVPKEGWEEKSLGQLGDLKNGVNFAHNEKGVDLHFLGVGDFGDRFSVDDVSELQMISLNQQPSEDYLLKDGDVVFVRSNGNKQLVGRSLVVYPGDNPTTFSGFCIRFRKSLKEIDEKFLVYLLKSENTRKRLFGNGANISNLNQKILQSLMISLPPLAVQQRIVARLDSLSENVRKYEEIQRKVISECDALKQALLRKVFE